MNLRLVSQPSGPKATIGELSIDGVKFCDTLEDVVREVEGPVAQWKIAGNTAIPGGEYSVLLTFSQRAKDGHLWTPNPDYKLPQLLAVPGFDGVRIHAGNTDADTEGCILVGEADGDDHLTNSRYQLSRIMGRIAEVGGLRIEIART